MRYIDISSYKALNLDKHGVLTPFKGHHLTVTNPLTGRLEVVLYADGYLETLPGFFHDWASGPTKDTPGTRYPALEHDALFRLLRTGQVKHFTWKDADGFLRDRLIECGVNRVRAWYWYLGRQIPGFARGKQAAVAKEPAYTICRLPKHKPRV